MKKILLNNIQLIIYDFDGVMTNNTVILSEEGIESVIVNRSDGYGVRMIKEELGITQIIISTEKNSAVRKRAEKLGIDVMYGVEDKTVALKEYCEKNLFDFNNGALFIGNDLNDYKAMKLCKYCMCPCDAEPEIIKISDKVLNKGGGEGIARELYRLLKELA